MLALRVWSLFNLFVFLNSLIMYAQSNGSFSKGISFFLIALILTSSAPLPLFAATVGPNLVPNPTLEIAAPNGIDPDGWLRGGFGVNDGVLSYSLNEGKDGGRAVKAVTSNYTDGDVKWFFAPVPVVAGKQYVFTDEYQSGTSTDLTAEYFDVNHVHLAYGGFFHVPASASGTYATARVTYVPPPGADSMTVLHSLRGVGSLSIDNVSLSEMAASRATLKTIVNVVGGAATGTDFQVTVKGGNANPAQFSGSTSGVDVEIDAAAVYSLSTTNIPRYKTTQSPACSGVLVSDVSLTCIITKTYLSGTTTVLNIVTNVVNTHGGTSQPSDFIVTVLGGNASTTTLVGSASVQPVVIAPMTNYRVSVNFGSAYAVLLSPDCGGVITEGDMVTCTITLSDVEKVEAGNTSSNLIINANLETVNLIDPTLPANWSKGHDWGGNIAQYEYPVLVASTSDSDIAVGKAARVSYALYAGDVLTGGDAKWYFAPVPVTPLHRYEFQDAYLSNTPTAIVAEFFDAAHNHLSYAGFSTVPDSGNSWKIAKAAFIVPASAAYMTVYHQLNSVGSLVVDNQSLREEDGLTKFSQGFVSLTFDDGYAENFTTVKPILDNAGEKATFYILSHNSGFGIKNASLETTDSTDVTKPSGWLTSGSANATFRYPVPGHTGMGAEVSAVENNSAAAWYYAPVSVFDDQSYQFSHFYKSTGVTEVSLQVTHKSGQLSYVAENGTLSATKIPYAIVPASSEWKQWKSENIYVPSGTRSVTVLHGLRDGGVLTIDDANMGSYLMNMTPDQVLLLQAGGHEIAGHSQTHADLNSLGSDLAYEEISGGRQDMSVGGVTPLVSFAYPYGNDKAEVQTLIKKAGFTSGRGVIDGYNGKNTNKYSLLSKLVDPDTKVSEVKMWIDQALADHTWLILSFHRVVDGPIATTTSQVSYATTPETLAGIVDYLKTNNIPVRTVRDGVSMMDGGSTTTPSALDSIAPVITLVGSSTMDVLLGGVFVDPGARALDNIDGNISAHIATRTSASINTNATGTHTIFYDVADAAGNKAIQVTRTVRIAMMSATTPAPTPIPLPTASIVSSGGGGGGSSTFTNWGCMNPYALNYSRLANRDDGRCLVLSMATSSSIASSTATSSSFIFPLPGGEGNRTPVFGTSTRGEVLGTSTYSFISTLRKGSRGNEVRALQERLTLLGFYKGPVTNYFGNLTAAAVRRFQSAHGFDQVGQVGPKTRAALNVLYRGEYNLFSSVSSFIDGKSLSRVQK